LSSSGASFGYFPDTRKLDDVLRRGNFTRALAIESPLKAAYAHGRECKIHWKPEVQLPVGIYFFDTVPGGAGVAKRIAANIQVVLQAAVRRVTSCHCGEETSCYGCLRSYRNGRSHELLSRSAALAIRAS